MISSWLLDLTAQALAKNESLSNFTGQVADSGEGRWTIEAAIEEAVPVPVLTPGAVHPLPQPPGNTFGEKLLSAMRFQFGGHVEQHDRAQAWRRRAESTAGVRRLDLDLPDAPGEGDAADGLLPRRSPACTMVIFGGGGDLTRRLLVPAIYNLVGAELLDESFSIVGVDRADLDSDGLRRQLGETMRTFVAQRSASAVMLQEERWDWLSQRISFLRATSTTP